MDRPIVSVVVAAKNEEEFVSEAVTSIMGQTGVAHELVFVDDGSTDRTYRIVEEFAARHQNLRLVRNPRRGKVSAFNHGVSLASGEWVCIFAGDDIMPAGSLAERWKAVKDIQSDKPVIGLCRLMQISKYPKQHGIVIPKHESRGGLTGVSYLMDRRAVAKIYPVPEELPNEDTWMETAVLHFENCLVHSGVIGCHWRVHAGNSMNFLVGFDEFNKRLTPRMCAYSVFLEQHGAELTGESCQRLEAKVECEEGRRTGNLMRIFRSGATTVEKLRAASLSNRPLYEIRRSLYGLLSGW